MASTIPARYFYIPSLLLALLAAFMFASFLNMAAVFPLHVTGMDYTSHMGRLYFLDQYGFGIAPNWYHGVDVFRFYPPALFVAMEPVYKLTGSIQLTFVIAVIAIYSLLAAAMYFLGSVLVRDKLKRIFFFILFFFNPVSLMYLLVLGRAPEMLAWLFFLLFAILIWKDKDREIDAVFFLVVPVYSLLLLSHFSVFIAASPLLVSLFLVKKSLRERLSIMLAAALAAVATAFWWIPLLFGSAGRGLGIGNSGNSFATIVPVEKVMLFVFPLLFLAALYWHYRNSGRKGMLFFLPLIVMALLDLTLTYQFVPFYNKLYVHHHSLLYLFFTLVLPFRLKFSKKIIDRAFLPVQVAAVIILAGIFLFFADNTYSSGYSQKEMTLLGYFSQVDGPVLFTNDFTTASPASPDFVSPAALLVYGTVYYNISSPDGWFPETQTPEYIEKLYHLRNQKLPCNEAAAIVAELQAAYLVTYSGQCQALLECNSFTLVDSGQDTCLLRTTAALSS